MFLDILGTTNCLLMIIMSRTRVKTLCGDDCTIVFTDVTISENKMKEFQETSSTEKLFNRLHYIYMKVDLMLSL